jgi:hypothetical protein
MDAIAELIDDFLHSGWKGTPMERAVKIATESPQDLPRLVKSVIERVPKGGTFFDFVFTFMPTAAWPELVSTALAALEANPDNDAAQSLIAYASLQALPSLHPRLDDILRLRPNKDCYYAAWPWRDSGDTHAGVLCGLIDDASQDIELRRAAWSALLETRTPQAVAFASERYAEIQPKRAHIGLDTYLQEVDFVRRDGTLARLDPPRVIHMCFPESFRTSQFWQVINPTWTFESVPAARSLGEAPFGGTSSGACSSCGGQLHHLITLDPVPENLGFHSVERLSIATCLSCLGWEEGMRTGFYAHDENGQPRDITNAARCTPQFPVGPLEEATVRLVETPAQWKWQDWALSNSRENLHRIGGHPCWIQGADMPRCPRCRERMPFLLQFDSFENWMWGSGGIAYVHWCDPCRVSALFWQCT